MQVDSVEFELPEGVQCETAAVLARLLGVYSDPGHIVEYGDGEVRQEYELIFLGVGGYGSFRACQARPESVVR